MDERSLGLRLQKARKEAGFTQQQLCQQSGLSYSTLAKIERGAIKSPSIFTIHQIAEALGTTIDALVGDLSSDHQKTLKKRSKNGISFVYFDINGCLVHFYQRAFAKVASETGVPSDKVESVFWQYNDAVCRGDIAIDEFNEILKEEFRVSSFDWNQYYLSVIEPIPESHQLLNWVSENYKVGLLSNIMPGVVNKMIDKGLIPDLDYDQIIESNKVGAIKPEDKIYQIATDRAGVDVNEILLIDDSRGNLMPAQRLGWRVMWFDDFRAQELAERIRKTLEVED